MKKTCIIFTTLMIVIISVFGVFYVSNNTKTENNEYLRIHIRANSNDEVDQNVKYKVKTAVVNFLTPKLTTCTDKEVALKIIENNISSIKEAVDKVLKDNGFNYTSSAKILNEQFPTRTYDNLTLYSGYYDALIIELGSGAGNNWWCVIYPPLCFVDSSNNYIYKSKIKEIIDNFFNRG